MCTDRRTWQNLSTRFAPKHEWHKIRMSGLRDILGVDRARGTVRVEPFVTVGYATRFLLARGHMLAVTLEIEDATLGGLAMAVGMTTHSHKVGLLFETVVAYEVIIADGTLLRVTREEHPDLFHALPWSHGTLGLLVALELKIVRSSRMCTCGTSRCIPSSNTATSSARCRSPPTPRTSSRPPSSPRTTR
jgi:delta24-sterol reductase